jgi:hypothetical protein
MEVFSQTMNVKNDILIYKQGFTIRVTAPTAALIINLKASYLATDDPDIVVVYEYLT